MPSVTLYGATHRSDLSQTSPTLAGSPTPTDIVDALDDPTTDQYIEMVDASNSLFEVVLFDLSGLPAGSVVTAVTLSFQHKRRDTGGVQVETCGIDDGGGFVAGLAETTRYGTWDELQTETLQTRYTLKNGALWSAMTSIGYVVRHNYGKPGDDYHELYWVRAVIEYDQGPPTVTVDTPTGNSETISEIGWTYTQNDGRPQTHYEARIWTEAFASQQDFDPGASDEYEFATGKVVSSSARSVAVNTGLPAGDYRAFVRVWSTSTAGAETVSEWAESSFTIDPPATPLDDPVSCTATFDPATGAVMVSVDNTGNTQIGDGYEIQRSTGGGLYERLDVITDASALTDPAPFHQISVYRARNIRNDGSAPSDFANSLAVSTVSDRWWLFDTADPSSFVNPTPADFEIVDNRASVLARSPGALPTGASSGPLGDTIRLTLRTLTRSDRVALLALLELGRPLRLVDILGNEWNVIVGDSVGINMLRARATLDETTNLRDAHEIPFIFHEVA